MNKSTQALELAAGQAWNRELGLNLPFNDFLHIWQAGAQYQMDLASGPDMTVVTRVDASNYCQILTLLGMEEEGDPVAKIQHLLALINSPEIESFLTGAHLEAIHQIEKWGEASDRQKRPADWFWLVGYLAGKALQAALSSNQEKALHHCISTAAALYNWHCAIKGQDVKQLNGKSDVELIVNNAFPGEANE